MAVDNRALIEALRAVQLQDRDVRKQIGAGNPSPGAVLVYADEGMYVVVNYGRQVLEAPVTDTVDLRTHPAAGQHALPVAP